MKAQDAKVRARKGVTRADAFTDDLADTVLSLPREFRHELDQYIIESPGSFSWKMQNFAKYVPRQVLSRFVLREEMFRRVLTTQGSIVECGVLGGGGLMMWAHLSAIFEPLNYQRKVIGFDTFAGFAEISDEDKTSESSLLHRGDLACDSYDDIMKAAGIFDKNRFLGGMPKVELVRGDIKETVPEYLRQKPETLVSLLYLDVDLFEPTKVAIEHFVPRMPKGAVLAFDELNDRGWPGETVAVLQSIGVRGLKIERFPYDTKASYAVLE